MSRRLEIGKWENRKRMIEERMDKGDTLQKAVYSVCGRKWGVKYLTMKPAGFYNRAAVGGMCLECFAGRTNGASGRVADAVEFLMEGEEGE